MKFRLITNLKDFKDIENDWNFLYRANERISPFQSFKFNYFSWKFDLINSKNTLAIVLAYDSKQIKAIFPFYIDKKRSVRFINDLHADFCDAISIVNIDFNEIIVILKSNFKISYFQLINLKNNNNLLNDFKISNCRVISNVNYSLIHFNKGVFPDNFQDYRSKQKTEFRRILKINIEKDHKIIDFTTSFFPRDQIITLRSRMILLGIRDNSFLSNNQLLYIEKLYLSGMLFLSIVSEKGIVNAISFIINSPAEYLIWIDLYDDSKLVNLYNYILVSSNLSAHESATINFGRGSYNYKIKNFLPEKKKLFSLYLFSSKYVEFIFFLKRIFMQFIKHFYRKII